MSTFAEHAKKTKKNKEQKPGRRRLSLLSRPPLAQCQSGEPACPKSQLLLASLSQPGCRPVPPRHSVSLYPVTRTQCRAKALVGLSFPAEALYLETPPPPPNSGAVCGSRRDLQIYLIMLFISDQTAENRLLNPF